MAVRVASDMAIPFEFVNRKEFARCWQEVLGWSLQFVGVRRLDCGNCGAPRADGGDEGYIGVRKAERAGVEPVAGLMPLHRAASCGTALSSMAAGLLRVGVQPTGLTRKPARSTQPVDLLHSDNWGLQRLHSRNTSCRSPTFDPISYPLCEWALVRSWRELSRVRSFWTVSPTINSYWATEGTGLIFSVGALEHAGKGIAMPDSFGRRLSTEDRPVLWQLRGNFWSRSVTAAALNCCWF